MFCSAGQHWHPAVALKVAINVTLHCVDHPFFKCVECLFACVIIVVAKMTVLLRETTYIETAQHQENVSPHMLLNLSRSYIDVSFDC